MSEKWEIVYYETSRGKSPVFEFIQNLNPKSKSKIFNTLELLREFGTTIGLPHSKKLTGSDIWELRVLGSDNIRIFYVAVFKKTFLLLHGFQKKKRKTDTKEIKTAELRLREYRSRLN